MKIAEVRVFPLQLPMVKDFSISSGSVGRTKDGAPHLYVRVTADNGISGWGEARPSPRWSGETLGTCVAAIEEEIAPVLVGQSIWDIKGASSLMDRQLRGNLDRGQSIAKSAVDIALHDLAAKAMGVPISRLWLRKPGSSVMLSYLICTQNVEEAVCQVREAKQEGYQGIDVKLFNTGRDIEIIEAIATEAVGLFVRVDANQAYTFSQALQVGRGLERLDVDVFEQPLQAGDFEGHAKLRRKLDVPIALDESVWTAQHVLQAASLEACDAIVVKLSKMGGAGPALYCGEVARSCGMDLLGGGLTESTLGLVASAHLFNALGIRHPVDLNGPFFLSDDPCRDRLFLTRGTVHLPSGNGFGIDVEEDQLRRFLFKRAGETVNPGRVITRNFKEYRLPGPRELLVLRSMEELESGIDRALTLQEVSEFCVGGKVGKWFSEPLRAGAVIGLTWPGQPERAAQDVLAIASQYDSGSDVYGEVFAAASVAASACLGDMEAIIRTGLSELDPVCHTARAILYALDLYRNVSYGKAKETLDKIVQQWPENHSDRQVMAVVTGVLFNQGNWHKCLQWVVNLGAKQSFSIHVTSILWGTWGGLNHSAADEAEQAIRRAISWKGSTSLVGETVLQKARVVKDRLRINMSHKD